MLKTTAQNRQDKHKEFFGQIKRKAVSTDPDARKGIKKGSKGKGKGGAEKGKGKGKCPGADNTAVKKKKKNRTGTKARKNRGGGGEKAQ